MGKERERAYPDSSHTVMQLNLAHAPLVLCN